MKFGSVCSGIEAASVAWEPLGWKAAWFSEIEPFPCAVLAHHYPDVPNLGDMTALPDRIRAGEVEAPDILCGGTPCQAFSVAGQRKSLDDARGNLSLTFCEIANAIDAARSGAGHAPAIIFWENVPGVLNTKDNAFGCFLGELAGESCQLEPAGGKWPNAGCVYGPQRTVAWRVLDAQFFGVAQRRRRVFVVASASERFDPTAVLFEFDRLRRDTAPSRQTGQGTAHATAPCLTSSGRGVERTGDTRGQDPVVAVATFDRQSSGEYGTQPVASTVAARDYKSPSDLVSYGIPGNWIGRAPENGGNAVEPMHDVAPCLTKTDQHGVAHPVKKELPLDPYLGGEVTIAIDASYSKGCGGTSAAESPVVADGMAVRRLTPVECERLQGFPDDYTLIPWRKKPASECPDGPRYKALGNSWAVPNVRWIGERIQLAVEIAGGAK